jgi:hypothetical protein
MEGLSPTATTPSDEWAIVLYGASGEALAHHPFTPRSESGIGEDGERLALIQETVPWEEGAVRVDVTFRGEALASVKASEHEPEVTLLSPNGGESLRAPQPLVTWEGHDDDGDPLVYALQYSPDAGASWQTLAVELRATAFQPPLDELPGSDRALFRVIASDGLRTAMDTSDGVFEVANKPPTALIHSPLPGAHYSLGQMVSLVGEGYDVEDGALGDEALTWRSDLQGPLGAGSHLSVGDLAQGSHMLTLEATDSHGLAGAASVLVHVDVHLLHLPLVIKP